MKSLGRFLSIATPIICLATLALSIYPGWLNVLLSIALVLGIIAAPVVVVWLIGMLVILYRRRDIDFPWKRAEFTVLILMITGGLLWFHVPLRIAFAACRGGFRKALESVNLNDAPFDRRIGIYHVDACQVDERGGSYFRVHTGGDGLGPDTVSYGFCYLPNAEGSPFGAAKYRTVSLGGGWHSFRASDDY